jgi:DNA-binding HxlR family transcriptional regulator
MRLLDVLGKRWSLRILWELRDERLTFRELRGRCDDVSPTSLNARLKELRALRLIDHDDAGFGYTRWGRELGEQLLALNAWAQRWDRDA